MAHNAIARLRGRAEPREEILNRLLDINPNFRVGWIPEGREIDGVQRPALWRIYEFTDHPMRRSAGHARFVRYERMSPAKQAENPGLVYQAEEALDGLNLVMDCLEEEFGTDAMFQALQQAERDLAPLRGEVKKAQDTQADDEIVEEMDANPEYSELVREHAKEFYNRVKGNAVVGVTANI